MTHTPRSLVAGVLLFVGGLAVMRAVGPIFTPAEWLAFMAPIAVGAGLIVRHVLNLDDDWTPE